MATLEYSEIRERKYIVLDGDPYEVLSCHIFRKQQRKPVNQTKLKNLITGKVTERSFGAMETAEEAEIVKRKVKHLFSKDNRQTGMKEYWFVDPDNSADRFFLPEDIFGPEVKFLKKDILVDAVVFDEKFIGVRLPIKMEVVVTEAAPAVRGNTVNNATKQVVIETGASIDVPMFVEQGDKVIINTETGLYVERAK
jgi:elongation factor P